MGSSLSKKGLSLEKKLELYGEGSLTNEELWSLFWGNGKEALCAAKLELKSAGGLKAFFDSSLAKSDQESLFHGKKALVWRVFQEMRKRGSTCEKKHLLDSPKKIFDLVESDFLGQNLEICLLVGRNKQKESIFVQKIGVGDNQKVFCRMRDIFQPLLYHNAAGFVLVHNHLLGVLTPSQEDLISTRTLEKVGGFLEIEMTDHLIVHQQNFLSLYELGYLRQRESY